MKRGYVVRSVNAKVLTSKHRRQLALEKIKLAKITIRSYEAFISGAETEISRAEEKVLLAQQELEAVREKAAKAPSIIKENKALIARLRAENSKAADSPEERLKKLREKIRRLEQEISLSS